MPNMDLESRLDRALKDNIRHRLVQQAIAMFRFRASRLRSIRKLDTALDQIIPTLSDAEMSIYVEETSKE